MTKENLSGEAEFSCLVDAIMSIERVDSQPLTVDLITLFVNLAIWSADRAMRHAQIRHAARVYVIHQSNVAALGVV